MLSSLVSQMLCCCQRVRDRDSKVAQKTLFKKITAKTDMRFSMKYLAGDKGNTLSEQEKDALKIEDNNDPCQGLSIS